jgi:phosphoribosyl 1,2-cyclic phosphodiesterase
MEYPICDVCVDAMKPGSKNRRRNTNLLIRAQKEENDPRAGDTINIMIDCGKHFWHSALEWFPKYQIRFIHGILITHRHVDACYGIDDLRDWTKQVPGNERLPIYLREDDLNYLGQAFDYLVDTSKASRGGGIATLEWNTIQPEDKDLSVEGLEIFPFEVTHGSLQCLGFKFGSTVYISDVSKIEDRVRDLIRNYGEPIELLILDLLEPGPPSHVSHYTLKEMLQEIRLLKPKRTLLIGMSHEIDHEQMNKQLAEYKEKENIDVQLAYDGMVVKVPRIPRRSSTTATRRS